MPWEKDLPVKKEDSKQYDLLKRLDLLEDFSFGLDDAIKNDGISNFMCAVAAGERIDCTVVQEEARQEFDAFGRVLRNLTQ